MTFTIDDLTQRIVSELTKDEDPNSEWKEYVPIVETDSDINIYLTSGISEPWEYSRAIHTILNATKPVKLHINNGGGFESSATMLYHAIKRSSQPVVAILSGLVASAATVITMACLDIEVAPNTMFMIHESSFEDAGGKFSDMRTFQSFYENHTKAMSKSIYGGFLTDTEIDLMHSGKELWFSSDEVIKRWRNKCTTVF